MISIFTSRIFTSRISSCGLRGIRSEEMSSLLIENGARINHVNSHMQTALDHLQEKMENSELVEYMKKQGVTIGEGYFEGSIWLTCVRFILYFWGCQ